MLLHYETSAVKNSVSSIAAVTSISAVSENQGDQIESIFKNMFFVQLSNLGEFLKFAK
jgi:hypothetical protein